MDRFKENSLAANVHNVEASQSPRLLYIGDVSVELSNAGSTLLYRLFEKYPTDKLTIFQKIGVTKSRSLQVAYHIFSNPILERLRRTRFQKLGSILEFILSIIISSRIERIIKTYRPEAIVTVTSRLSWILAYRVAKKYKLPLHLILHDDIVTGENHGNFLNGYLEKYFKKAYLLADSRLCVSSNMEKYYREKYGVSGKVLYPMRGFYDEVVSVSDLSFTDKQELHFCYAGSLPMPDFLPMLNQLAQVLYEKNCRLTIFCDADKYLFSKYDFLMKDHISINQFIHPDQLKEFMRQEVDVNVVLNSFEQELPFRFNFPSKLVDYTAVGLPVLIWAAPSSSIVSWAQENDYNCVLTDQKLESLQQIVQQLKKAGKRNELAFQITNLGKSTFGYEVNYKLFINSIVCLNNKG